MVNTRRSVQQVWSLYFPKPDVIKPSSILWNYTMVTHAAPAPLNDSRLRAIARILRLHWCNEKNKTLRACAQAIRWCIIRHVLMGEKGEVLKSINLTIWSRGTRNRILRVDVSDCVCGSKMWLKQAGTGVWCRWSTECREKV